MIEVKFNTANYPLLLKLIGQAIKSPVKDNCLHIPLGLGTGWIWTEELPNGITLMVSDTKINQEISFHRAAINENTYSVQFNEIYAEKADAKGVKTDVLLNSYVEVFNVQKAISYTLPAGIRLKSFKFYFNRYSLLNLIDEDTATKLFDISLADDYTQSSEVIDFAYRPILEELMVPHINHPFKKQFLQNRIMLLLETFLEKKQSAKVVHLHKRINNSDLERLMQVESLLIRDYSEPPPTIEKLSRISAMSCTKLKKSFKSIYGIPIYEYYQKNRMAKAKAMLNEGLYTCKEVGVMIGYTNLSHFAAAFKKEFGITPSELLTKKEDILYAV